MASISDYKKQHPEYRNIPDLQLAEIMYEKAYKGKLDETEFYKLAFPNIAAERAEDVYTDFVFPDDEFGGAFESESTFKPTTSEIAKQAGVSVNDPATSKSRFAASLGYNQEQKALAVQNVLSEQFGQDIDVRTGPQTGELEYLNPKTKQYALVDAPGFDMGDFADLGGDSMVIIPDLVATVVGTIYTGPTGGITAGAISAGAGEFARLKLGQKLYNINQDLTDSQLLTEAFKTAGISGAAGFVGLGGAKLIKGVNNMIKGRSFSFADDAVKTLEDTKFLEADEIANTINKRLEDARSQSKLKFTLGEAIDDADLLATQASFENVRRLGKIPEFREFGQKQAGALNEYFKVIKQQYGNSTGSAYDTGVLIKEVVERRNKDAVKNIIKKQEASEDLLTKTVFRLPDGSSKTTGAEFRSIINDLSTAYKSNAKLAAKELDNVTGIKTINTDEIAKAINKLSDKEKKIMINTAKIEGLFQKEAFEQLMNPKGTIPLANARETISALGKLIREKEIGLAAGETVDVGRLKFLKGAYTEQVKKNAGAEYLDELQKFNELIINNKELLNNDIISKLTKVEIGNILKVGDEAIFETTFKKGINNAKEAKQVYDVISRSPEALNAYKNSIFDFYKTRVLVDGKPNLSKHNAFIKAYEKPLRTFFNEAEYNKISRIGGLQKNIERTNKLFTQTTNELNKSFEGKLINSTPQEIFNKIYKPGNIGEIKTLKNILQKNPDVYKKFQRDVLADLNERVTVRSDKLSLDKFLDSKAFNNYLNGAGGERGYKVALREIFGDEYVKNLEVLNKALQISGRKPVTRAAEGVVGNAFTDIIRARLGQFTTPGRLFTAGRRLFQSASNRLIARALLNPTSLKEFVALRQLKRGSKQAAIILAKLGGSIFILPDEGTPVPPKEAVIEQDVDTTQNLRGLFNRRAPASDDRAQIQTPQLNTPGISEALLTTASARPTGINASGLTPIELGLLSPEEQAIRLRQRGMA